MTNMHAKQKVHMGPDVLYFSQRALRSFVDYQYTGVSPLTG